MSNKVAEIPDEIRKTMDRFLAKMKAAGALRDEGECYCPMCSIRGEFVVECPREDCYGRKSGARWP